LARKNKQSQFIIKIKQNGKTRLMHIHARSPEQATKKVKERQPSADILFVRKNKINYSM